MLKTTGLGSFFTGLGMMLNNISLSLFNLPPPVFVMAFAGAALSFAWSSDDEAELPKKKMYKLVAMNTIGAVALTAVLPGWLGWDGDWYTPKMAGSLALILAASARFIIPILRTLAPEIMRKWFRLGEYSTKANKENAVEQEVEVEVQPEAPAKRRSKQ